MTNTTDRYSPARLGATATTTRSNLGQVTTWTHPEAPDLSVDVVPGARYRAVIYLDRRQIAETRRPQDVYGIFSAAVDPATAAAAAR